MTPARIGKALPWISLLCASPALAASLAMVAPAPAFAADTETTLSVTATPNPVTERDSLQLQIEVDSPLTTVIVEPSFEAPDFIKAGSPEMKFQPHAGDFGPNTRKKLVFTFVLMPRHAGKFTIRNIGTKAAGRPLNAPDISVTVEADAAGPRPPAQWATPPAAPRAGDDDSSNPAAPNYQGRAAPPSGHAVAAGPSRFNSDFTVWATVSKAKAYVGEPILTEYYLYDFGGVRQTEVLQWPNFTGFWREDLELTSHIDFEEVYVNQQEARRAFIARYALYGIKPGHYALDKLGMQARYVPSDILNPALFFNMDLRTGKHFSQDVNIEILPLPEAGRPANFGGAVGKFALRLDADKKTLAQNTPVTLTFTLEGTGNFQAIETIKAPLPPDFELYESTANGRPPGPVGGRQDLASKKTFQTVAIPRKAGHFDIPAVSWSYFDPDKEAYLTLTTQPFALDVTPSDSTAAAVNTYLAPDKGGAPPPSAGGDAGAELRYLKPVDLSASKPAPDPFALAALGLLALNALLLLRFLRGRSRGLLKIVRSIDPFSEARIGLLQAKGIRDSGWQASLEEVVLTTIQVLLDTNPRGLPRHEVEGAWKSRGLPARLFQRAAALLDEIDRHRFSSQKLSGSGTQEVRSRLTKEAESLLSEASQARKKR